MIQNITIIKVMIMKVMIMKVMIIKIMIFLSCGIGCVARLCVLLSPCLSPSAIASGDEIGERRTANSEHAQFNPEPILSLLSPYPTKYPNS